MKRHKALLDTTTRVVHLDSPVHYVAALQLSLLGMAIQVRVSGTRPDRDGYEYDFLPTGGTCTKPEPKRVWARVFFSTLG
jgi:hypothetical protein